MRKFSITVNGQAYEVEVEEIGGGSGRRSGGRSGRSC